MTGKRGTVYAIDADTLTIETAMEALGAAVFDDQRKLADRLLRLCVNYRPRGARTTAIEVGVITGVNDRFVFVRYWGQAESKATAPDCLTWAYPR